MLVTNRVRGRRCCWCWSLTIVTDQVDVAVVLGALFVLGVNETFGDTTTSTLMPMLVAKADLGIANARPSPG